MKKYVFNILLVGIFLCITIFIFSSGLSAIKVAINHYKNPYLIELKIPLDWKISSLINIYGDPIKITNNENSDYNNYIYEYDGFSLIINKADLDKNSNNARFDCIKITGKQYKFTKKNIVIGRTKRSDILNYYKYAKPIKDLSKGEIGFIVDGYWMYFIFDENDYLKEILITYGL